MSVRECKDRCGAATKSGGRCGRKTCTYPGKCWQHTYTQERVWIKPSLIRGAGNGLFARGRLPAGTEFVYEGTKKRRREVEAEYPGTKVGPYVICNGNHPNSWCWDAKSTQSCLARYANDAHGTQFEHNAEFVAGRRAGDPPKLVLTRDLEPMEEILVDYGDEYWTEDLPDAPPGGAKGAKRGGKGGKRRRR